MTWRVARWFLALGAIGVVPWLHTLGFEFVYDDEWTIVRNPHLKRGLGELLQASLSGVGASAIPDSTRPLMVASNWLDLHLFGLWAPGHHLTSILLHGLLVVVAGLCARRLLGSPRAALGTAALFAVAPGHFEAVSSINYREDLLAALGVFGALAVLLWHRRSTPLWVDLVGAGAWLLGLLSKESAIALVPMLVAVVLTRAHPRRWLATRERGLTLLLAVLLLWGNWRWALWLNGDGVPQATADFDTWAERFGTYLGWAAWSGLTGQGGAPVHLAPSGWIVAGGVALICGVLLLGWRLGRLKQVGLGVLVLLSGALGSSPVLSPFNAEADRYLVLASLGAAVVVISLVTRAGRPLAGVRALVVLAVLGWWGLLAARDSLMWTSNAALWREAAARAPESPKAWTGMAWVARREGRLEEARQALARALDQDIDYPSAHAALALLLLQEGDAEGSRREVARAASQGGPPPAGLPQLKQCLELAVEAQATCAAGIGAREQGPAP